MARTEELARLNSDLQTEISGRKEAEDLIMAARIEAGWIKAEDLIEPEPEVEPEEAVDEAPADEAISIGKVFGDLAKPAS